MATMGYYPTSGQRLNRDGMSRLGLLGCRGIREYLILAFTQSDGCHGVKPDRKSFTVPLWLEDGCAFKSTGPEIG